LKGRQIHKAIGSSWEGLHSIRIKNMIAMVVKFELSKACDRTCWLYLRLFLIHVRFCLLVVNWIMGCLTSISFYTLTNGFASHFFIILRGLRQGCPLSPYLFLLVAEWLSRSIMEARRERSLHGVRVWGNEYLTHLLFLDNLIHQRHKVRNYRKYSNCIARPQVLR
jgi:hypothetical protein